MADRPTPAPLLRGGMRAVTAFARALGPLRYPVADGVAMCVYAAQAGRRRRAVANHRRNDGAIDERTARRLARRSFREYGRTTADFLWANGMDLDRVRRTSTVRGLEPVHAALAAGSGGVLALSHHGNWDMAALVGMAHGLRLTTVMAPIGPRPITDVIIWARERNHLEVFTPERAARGLLRAVRRNRLVALLSDIPGAGPTVVVDFCGGPVSFSAVPAWLTLRTGAPLFAVDCFRGRRGDAYEVDVHPVAVEPGDDVTTLTQRLARELERCVRLRPAQWYPFGRVYADEAAAGEEAAPD